MSTLKVTGRELTSEEEQIDSIHDDLLRQSIPSLNDAAKQLVGWIAGMYALFFVAFSFSQAPQLIRNNTLLKIVGPLMLVLYFASMLLSMQAFIPRSYSAHEHNYTEKRQVIEQIAAVKRRLVTLAYVVFTVATFSLAVFLVVMMLAM